MLSAWLNSQIEVIPAVDVLGEGAVRLHQGAYDEVVEEAGDPVGLARRFAAAGARRIHLVDLDGARSGTVRPELVRLVAETVAPALLQASGGIRSLDDARALLEAGADRVVVGTAAFPDPGPWAAALGERLVVALDVRDGAIRTAGWTADSGLSLAEAVERCLAAGVTRALSTAIDRDGTLAGPDLDLVASVAASGLRVLAAGGVRSPADVLEPPPAPGRRRPSSGGRCSRRHDRSPVAGRPSSCLSCFQAATRRLPASHEVNFMRKLAITMVVSITLGLAASAVAALPSSGPFTGKTSLHPVNGFPDLVTFTAAGGGRTLKKFTFGTLGCFGTGAFPVGVDPYGLPDSTALFPAVTVTAKGTFLLTAKVKWDALDASSDPVTTATVKGTVQPGRRQRHDHDHADLQRRQVRPVDDEVHRPARDAEQPGLQLTVSTYRVRDRNPSAPLSTAIAAGAAAIVVLAGCGGGHATVAGCLDAKGFLVQGAARSSAAPRPAGSASRSGSMRPRPRRGTPWPRPMRRASTELATRSSTSRATRRRRREPPPAGCRSGRSPRSAPAWSVRDPAASSLDCPGPRRCEIPNRVRSGRKQP